MIADFEARRSALDPLKSFIVQAPAGSGKTGLLVYRMLTLLAQVEKPQQVLAITFTRKATAEMQERLLGLMKCADRGIVSNNGFEQQGIELAAQVLAQDKKHNWRLIDAPHQLQILTIDSFCSKLTASMPWLSRLGDRPRTTDQADTYYAAAIEQLFNELLEPDSLISAHLRTVMLELDFNYNKARQLFSSMLAKRDQWLRHLLQGNLASMRAPLENAWQNVVEAHLIKSRQALSDEHRDQLCDLARYAAGNLAAKGGVLSPLKSFENYREGDNLSLEHWRALSHLLLTGKSIRKRVDKRLGFEAKTANTNRMHELLKQLADDQTLLEVLSETKALPQTTFSEADWEQLLALDIVLKALAALLQLQFRASGECDHSEVTQRANLALQELENPTDLGLRMDAHLHHILVDEFQDTSHGQIELLKKLTAGWGGLDEAKTLFLVGDPMQSIYRFREADVSLFLQVSNNHRTRIFPDLEIEALRLTENFRSTESLVQWFNSTFSDSFPQTNDVLSGSVVYSAASSTKESDAPACEYLLGHDREQEADLLLASVEQALSDLNDQDDQVAVLVRTRSQLDYLLPRLKRAGIAYTGIDIQPLAGLQAVIDVLTLCKAICREDDRVAWLSLLRGPWCGLSLAKIKHLVGRQDISVWSQLKGAQSGHQANTNLGRFIKLMGATMEQRQRVPLASLTRWCWIGLGGEHTLLGSSKDDIEVVFGLLNELEKGGDLTSISDLDRAVSGLYARTHADGDHTNGADLKPRVVVSTMHKAKGLQYHTVILPGLSNTPRNADKEVLMWAEAQNSFGQSDLLLAPLSAQNSDSLHYQYLRHLDAKRSANEAIRLMYVAATRAEKKLVLIARAKLDSKTSLIRPPAKGSLLATVWASLESRFLFSLPEPTAVERCQTMPQTLSRLPENFDKNYRDSIQWQVRHQLNRAPTAAIEASQDGAQIEYEWATGVATGVGIVLHDCLQYSAEKVLSLEVNAKLRQRWRAELVNLRVPVKALEYAVQRLVVAIENIQAHSDAHFLFRDYPESHNEFTLSAIEDGSVNKYRLDRTFVDDDGLRWIVDYKSTAHDNNDDVVEFAAEQVRSRHKQQLEKYGFLFSQVDARPIQLAVYFPLLKQLVSWRYQPEHYRP